MRYVSKLVTISGIVLLSAMVMAEELTPERYVKIDLDARRATVEAMATRLSAVQQNVSEVGQHSLGLASEDKIKEVYTRNGSDSVSHSSYGATHRDEITAWIEEHPDSKVEYDSLRAQFDSISTQLDGLKGGR